LETGVIWVKLITIFKCSTVLITHYSERVTDLFLLRVHLVILVLLLGNRCQYNSDTKKCQIIGSIFYFSVLIT